MSQSPTPITQRQARLLNRILKAGGAARMRDLAVNQPDRRALHVLAKRGLLRKHPSRVFALPEAPPEVIIARRLGGLICCGKALEHYGDATLLRPGGLHVLVKTYPSPESRAGLSEVVIHRDRNAVMNHLGSPYASPTETLCVFLTCGSELEALVAADAFYSKELVEPADLLSHFQAQRYGPARRILRRCRKGVRSPIETVARYDLENAGFHVDIAELREGYELDILIGGILNVETDGYAYHSNRDAWNRDRDRDSTLLAAGITPLRLSYSMVMNRETVSRVRPVAEQLGLWPT